MIKLVGNPKKVFKIIYKRYKKNNLINSDEIRILFPNNQELEEDLTYLNSLELIDHDYNWNYVLTAQGRIYYKSETAENIETVIKSIFCPIVVSFVTSILTTLLTLWLSNLQ